MYYSARGMCAIGPSHYAIRSSSLTGLIQEWIVGPFRADRHTLDNLALGWKRVDLPKVGEALASDDEIKMQNRAHAVCREAQQPGCYGPLSIADQQHPGRHSSN